MLLDVLVGVQDGQFLQVEDIQAGCDLDAIEEARRLATESMANSGAAKGWSRSFSGRGVRPDDQLFDRGADS